MNSYTINKEIIYFCIGEKSKSIALELLNQLINALAHKFQLSSPSNSPIQNQRPYQFIYLEPEIELLLKKFNQLQHLLQPHYIDTPTESIEYHNPYSTHHQNQKTISSNNKFSSLLPSNRLDEKVEFIPSYTTRYLLCVLLLCDLNPFIKFWIYGQSYSSFLDGLLFVTSPFLFSHEPSRLRDFQPSSKFAFLNRTLNRVVMNGVYTYSAIVHGMLCLVGICCCGMKFLPGLFDWWSFLWIGLKVWYLRYVWVLWMLHRGDRLEMRNGYKKESTRFD